MHHYERLGTVRFEQVLPAINSYLKSPHVSPKFIELLGAKLKISGLRLRTFAERPLCCSNPACKSVPTHFSIERDKGNPLDSPSQRAYHLNLYGRNEDGNEVLFTHDHTLARGLGGEDSIENTTTMCLPCNQKKSRLEGALVNRRQRQRQGFVQSSSPSDRKIERQRTMFENERDNMKMETDVFRAYCHEQGMLWREGKPLEDRGSQDPRRRIAELLGMSLEGFIFLRHAHNERMQAIFALHEQQAGIGPPRTPQMR